MIHCLYENSNDEVTFLCILHLILEYILFARFWIFLSAVELVGGKKWFVRSHPVLSGQKEGDSARRNNLEENLEFRFRKLVTCT